MTNSMTRPVPAASDHDLGDDLSAGNSWPVVVVGAGPAGLVTAISLARAGIRCLVLNRRTRPAQHPRATVISLRNMELFRSWGLADAITAGGHEVEWLMLVTTTLADAAAGVPVQVGYPSVAESALLSPTRPACVPQDHLEAVLTAHLKGLPAARLVTGIDVEDVSQEPDGHHLQLHQVQSGLRMFVRCRYLIGADGSRSIVRERLGRTAFATDEQAGAFSVLLHAPLWDVVADRRYGIYVTDQSGPATFLPAGRPDRWVFAFNWERSEGAEPPAADARLLARIRSAAGVPDLPVRIVATNHFSFSAAIAEKFRIGDAFLVGDAAHRVTPRGGTGMNSAIADGFNLGWKLGWRLNGWAGNAVLDSYESERRPVAEHNLIRSLDPMGSRRDSRDELAFDLGGRLAHHWLDARQGPISTLDLPGPGLTLLTTRRHSRSIPPVVEGLPIVVHHLDRSSAAKLGADRPGGLLLRPDGIRWDPSRLSLTDFSGRRGDQETRGLFAAVDRPEPAVAR